MKKVLLETYKQSHDVLKYGIKTKLLVSDVILIWRTREESTCMNSLVPFGLLRAAQA